MAWEYMSPFGNPNRPLEGEGMVPLDAFPMYPRTAPPTFLGQQLPPPTQRTVDPNQLQVGGVGYGGKTKETGNVDELKKLFGFLDSDKYGTQGWGLNKEGDAEKRGLYNEEQKKMALGLGLLNFGAAILGGMGWSPQKKTGAQILGPALAAGGQGAMSGLQAGKEAEKQNYANDLSKAHERYYNYAGDADIQAKLTALKAHGDSSTGRYAINMAENKRKAIADIENQSRMAAAEELRQKGSADPILMAMLSGNTAALAGVPEQELLRRQQYIQQSMASHRTRIAQQYAAAGLIDATEYAVISGNAGLNTNYSTWSNQGLTPQTAGPKSAGTQTGQSVSSAGQALDRNGNVITIIK